MLKIFPANSIENRVYIIIFIDSLKIPTEIHSIRKCIPTFCMKVVSQK